MARAGSEVILAGRNPEKGAAAIARIRNEVPSATIRFEQLDLASLKSVAALGERLRDQRDSLDLLINNAGIMVPPKREETSDGFELQLGTNYLGHFALTGQLMPLLVKGRNARVVTLSSIAARNGAIDFDDLNAERRYKPMPVYSQSKLACLMFAIELQRRSEAGGWGVASIAAHPGISRTDLLHNGYDANLPVVHVPARIAGRAPDALRRHIAPGGTRRLLRPGRNERSARTSGIVESPGAGFESGCCRAALAGFRGAYRHPFQVAAIQTQCFKRTNIGRHVGCTREPSRLHQRGGNLASREVASITLA